MQKQNQVISAMDEFKYCSDSSSEMNGKDNLDCSNDFQGIVVMEGFEDEDITNTEETNCSSSFNNNGKKKRLTTDQVQALEKIFEVDSKLDQDRKIKLAQELGLQPRQVAIWFQNRRARWKTKQLERDFRLLKANYESLQLNYSQIEREKEGLVAELRGLKEKLGEENSVEKASTTTTENQEVHNNYYTNCNPPSSPSFIIINKQTKDFKERLSSDDSDSSTGLILNEDSYFNTHPMTSRLSDHGLIVADHQSSAAFSSSTSVYPHPHHPPPPPPPSSSLMDSSIGGAMMMRAYQQQVLSMEEQQNFFTGDDESCNMMMPLPTDETPLFWYFSDKRN